MLPIDQTARPSRLYGRNNPRDVGVLVVYRDADGVERTTYWERALPGHRSPCRVDSSKGLRQHRCSRSHAELVEGYRSWREAEYSAAEAATSGYATELAEYWESHTRPTLRAYLEGMRDADRDAA